MNDDFLTSVFADLERMTSDLEASCKPAPPPSTEQLTDLEEALDELLRLDLQLFHLFYDAECLASALISASYGNDMLELAAMNYRNALSHTTEHCRSTKLPRPKYGLR